MNARDIAVQYFRDHPLERDSVMKAYYAYHAPHFRITTRGHNFTNQFRHSKCQWCNRSREQVRWDGLPAHCQKRPELPEIEGAIRYEETRYMELLERAERIVPRIISKRGMSQDTIKYLYDTHGIDQETVERICESNHLPASA